MGEHEGCPHEAGILTSSPDGAIGHPARSSLCRRPARPGARAHRIHPGRALIVRQREAVQAQPLVPQRPLRISQGRVGLLHHDALHPAARPFSGIPGGETGSTSCPSTALRPGIPFPFYGAAGRSSAPGACGCCCTRCGNVRGGARLRRPLPRTPQAVRCPSSRISWWKRSGRAGKGEREVERFYSTKRPAFHSPVVNAELAKVRRVVTAI